jgi:hypothetical protein
MHVTMALCVALATTCAPGAAEDPWSYDGRFHRVIAEADRIIVRDTCKNQDTFFEITGPNEIKKVHEQVQFQSPQEALGSCFCGGYPAIEWYKGKRLVAHTSVKHGIRLRWDGFQGDARLTKRSCEWILNWLAEHGVVDPFADTSEIQAGSEKEARQTLQRLVPAGFLEAAGKGRAEFQRRIKNADLSTLSSVKSEAEIKADYIHGAVRDNDLLFTTLFRLLGCLPMRWDVLYQPEQEEAYEFLASASPHELNQAIRTAVKSSDAAVREGAARFVILESSSRMGDELAAWVEMLAAIAYGDTIPQNRQLVVHCLAAYPKLKVMHVLERAVEDPYSAVRREAIDALQANGSPEAVQVLRRIAAGKAKPRKRPALPRDYSSGIESSRSNWQLPWDPEPEGTDQEAAAKALRALSR